MISCPPRYRRGGFLFVLKPQQISHRNTKVLGDLVGSGGIKVFLAAGLKVGDGAPTNSYLGAHLARSDVALGAEGIDAVI